MWRAICPTIALSIADAVEPVVLVLGRLALVDHRERVEAEARAQRELDESARPGASTECSKLRPSSITTTLAPAPRSGAHSSCSSTDLPEPDLPKIATLWLPASFSNGDQKKGWPRRPTNSRCGVCRRDTRPAPARCWRRSSTASSACASSAPGPSARPFGQRHRHGARAAPGSGGSARRRGPSPPPCRST